MFLYQGERHVHVPTREASYHTRQGGKRSLRFQFQGCGVAAMHVWEVVEANCSNQLLSPPSSPSFKLQPPTVALQTVSRHNPLYTVYPHTHPHNKTFHLVITYMADIDKTLTGR